MIERLLLRDRVGSSFGQPPGASGVRAAGGVDALEAPSPSQDSFTLSPAYSVGAGDYPPDAGVEGAGSASDILAVQDQGARFATEEPGRYPVSLSVKKVRARRRASSVLCLRLGHLDGFPQVLPPDLSKLCLLHHNTGWFAADKAPPPKPWFSVRFRLHTQLFLERKPLL